MGRRDRLLGTLARVEGVECGYTNASGERCITQDETIRRILAMLGRNVSSPVAIRNELVSIRAAQWGRLVAPVLVVRVSREPRVVLTFPRRCRSLSLRWELNFEDGSARSNDVPIDSLRLIRTRWIGDEKYERRLFSLPGILPLGYHRLKFSGDDASMSAEVSLIVVPDRCYLPVSYESGERRWGIAAQLYSLHSPQGGSLGSFGELRKLLDIASRVGAATVGLNPLHARRLQFPDDVSPYSPSSRVVFDPVYLDPAAVAERFGCSIAVDDESSGGETSGRDGGLIDYRAEIPRRLKILRTLFGNIVVAGSPAEVAFERFSAERGEPLHDWAVFEALEEYFAEQGEWGGYPSWPTELQSANGGAVEEFGAKERERVRFFKFLQWLVELELSELRERAERCGLELGLYLDLALGTTRYGADVWRWPELYLLELTLGAPPDELNLHGQSWGLPPFHPRRLYESGYLPIIEALRATMRFAGVVRIDHAMSLSRVFCIPVGETAESGAYVKLRATDLFGIVALESQRNKTIVIGEDLGTVPTGFEEMMDDNGVLHYRLLMFMKSGIGGFLPPGAYPRASLAAFGTHDLPTVRGFLSGRDLDLRSELQLFPTALCETRLRRQRMADLDALRRQLFHTGDRDPVLELNRFLANTEAYLVMVPLEDVCSEMDQVNLPGVTTAYPSWRRKLSISVEELSERTFLNAIGDLMREAGRSSLRIAAAPEGR